jgi:hypothetical protein
MDDETYFQRGFRLSRFALRNRAFGPECPPVVVGKAYCAQRATVRVADVLIGGGNLKITSVDMRIGDRVTAGTRLIGYEAPLEQVIQEKNNLSGHRVTGSESDCKRLWWN